MQPWALSLLDKLTKLTEGKKSQGVKDYLDTEIVAKGQVFTAEAIKSIEDFESINLSKWTTDNHINEMVRATVMNYLHKSKQLSAEL